MDNLMNISTEMERKRLLALIDSAGKHARIVNQRAVEGSREIGKEKTQYFEKIALASAGTIALVVSFVGSHTEKLHPSWLLRSALLVLLLAMIAAMYRNWKYPYYLIASYLLEQFTADQETERRRADMVEAFGSSSININDGRPVNVPKSLSKLKEVDGIFERKIAEFKKDQASALGLVGKAEIAALSLIVIAMVMLMVLAWINF